LYDRRDTPKPRRWALRFGTRSLASGADPEADERLLSPTEAEVLAAAERAHSHLPSALAESLVTIRHADLLRRVCADLRSTYDLSAFGYQ
jgi:hypothetical protein